MKVSYKWINEYLNNKAPSPEKVDDLLTMHSMEVEGTDKVGNDTVIDVKTLPNNSHSCLCHRGIAREVGVLTGIKPNLYSRKFKDFNISKTSKNLEVKIDDSKLCRRYIGRVVENIKVGPSPKWLAEKLETLGQRSINNIVDATNFVMLEIGQPMHAFDSDKIGNEIVVKNAYRGQRIITLDKKDVELDENVLLITDGENPLAIAGIKGGDFAELEMNTKNIILESANFNPVNVRKTAQRIKIQTDASKRYENDLTPEIAGEAMDILTKLIIEIAGTKDTKVGEVVDNYPRRANKFKLGISSAETSSIIGLEIKDSDIEKIFDRFGFEWKKVKPIDEVIKIAQTLVGTSYKLGASISYDAPKVFDCSGFIGYCFAQAGVQIPRISVDQYTYGTKINEKDLKAGDTIFSNTKNGKIFYETVEFLPGTKIPEGVDHCGIYLGDGKVIHDTSLTGKVVIEDLKTSESFKNIVGYRRMSDNNERFVITVPDERLDLRIKEDLAEEIGRIYGYEKIKDVPLPKNTEAVKIEKGFAYKEKIRRILYQEGFSEVMNYTFVSKGEIELANPMSPERKYLRTNLTDEINKSLELNARYSELIDMPQIRIFEFGHIFKNNGEESNFIIGVKNPLGLKKPKEKEVLDATLKIISEKIGIDLNGLKIAGKDENVAEFNFAKILEKLPEVSKYDFSEIGDKNMRYKKISAYPFMIRDIAVFTPEGTKSEELLNIINKEAGSLMLKNRLFDVFTKTFEDGTKKTSYAYRIIFQSYEKTLSDEEVNSIMQKITDKMNTKKDWQVR
jgi:phenylalanyl-tRNA synthetase beta subunit